MWERIVPRIPEQYLQSVIYLYPTEEDAYAGKSAGGSGFIVSVRSVRHPDRLFAYAVTAHHVIEIARSPVVRLNTHDSDVAVIPFQGTAWTPHPAGDDESEALV